MAELEKMSSMSSRPDGRVKHTSNFLEKLLLIPL